ncbi:MAG: enoyl-CoA hydratase/carnithine racemase [Desulforhopalus sp.]|jgi:enoyl-CoA hydratase/carnithine racemase
MSYEHIITTINDRFVGTITLNRPEQLNTFNSLFAVELNTALQEMDENPDVRVILIRGAGKAFSAGIDVNELEGKSAMEYRAWIENMEKPLISIARLKKPVIAQVQGVAVANGMGLAVAADLTIAADNVKMGLTAINVGLNCVGPIIPVARCVGRKKALELLLFGELIKGPELKELGLVNRLVPKSELDAEAMLWAEKLAQKSPIAVQIAKQGFYSTEDMDYFRQFDLMNEAFARLCTTADAKEGVKAFFEKRNPQWENK